MIRVGVLRGGTSNKYDQSLKTGAYVLKYLPKNKYEVVDIFVDKNGVWHMGGLPTNYNRLRHKIDLVWNTLSGFYGDDGKVQQLLENIGIPYTGSSPFVSAISANKKLLNNSLSNIGVNIPRGIYIENWGEGDRENTVAEVVGSISFKLSPPWNVESISKGQSNGSIRCYTRDELNTVLLNMYNLGTPVFIEQVTLGKKVSIISMNNFRGKNVYTFLPVKKDNPNERFSKQESENLQKIAEHIHHNLGFKNYSCVEAIITPRGHIYVIGIETVPSFHEEGVLQHSLKSVGSSFQEFAQHFISGVV